MASSPPRRAHKRCRRQENGYRHQTDRHDPRRCDASAAFKVDVLPDVHVEPPSNISSGSVIGTPDAVSLIWHSPSRLTETWVRKVGSCTARSILPETPRAD